MGIKKKIPDHAKCVFEGVLFKVYQWEQEMFDGSFATFEGLKKRPSVTILATTENDKILVSLEEQPFKGKYSCLPGGLLDSYEEDFLEAAKRELEEETGYISEDWKIWKMVDIYNAKIIEADNVYFVARNCKNIGKQKFDPGEKIESKLVSFEEFIEFSQREDFRNLEIKNICAKIKDQPLKLEEFRKEIFGI